MKKGNPTKFSKKNVFLTSAIALVIVLGLALYQHIHSNNASKAAKPAVDHSSHINYGPPTQADKDAAQANKKALAQQQQTPPPAGKQQVTPVITNASQAGPQVTVNSYVNGVFEDDGVCTVTFTHGSLQVTKTSTGFANATNTGCPPVIVNSSEFAAKGTWQVSVSYDSATASGTSQTGAFTIQ